MGSTSVAHRAGYKNPDPESQTRSANWYDSCFEDIINTYKPVSISSKIHYTLKSQSDIYSHGLPIGIISLAAHKGKVPLSFQTKIKLKSAKTFGLPKGTDPYKWIDHLSDGKPHWDVATKDAILAAIAAS